MMDSLTAIAQIVSSIAIVATLAYLAVQTKQTNRALNANSPGFKIRTACSMSAYGMGMPQRLNEH